MASAGPPISSSPSSTYSTTCGSGYPIGTLSYGMASSHACVISVVSVQPYVLSSRASGAEHEPVGEARRADRLAADDHQAHAGGQVLGTLGEVVHQLVPERGRQVQHRDLLTLDHTQEPRERAGVRVGVEHQRRARGERRQNLLETGVPVQRRELQDPVGGRDTEQVAERGGDGRDRPHRRRHGFRRSGGPRREQHVRGHRTVGHAVAHGPHRGKALGRERRVERAVGTTREPHPEQGGDRVRGPGRWHADDARPVPERRRDRPCPRAQLPVGDRPAVMHQRRPVGRPRGHGQELVDWTRFPHGRRVSRRRLQFHCESTANRMSGPAAWTGH